MSLQWYPGHMTKARRELAAKLPSQDVVLEVLDARMPMASTNPVITELRGTTPCIKILTRADLADPEVTRAWVAQLGALPGCAAFASINTRAADTRKRVFELCKQLKLRHTREHPLHALIAGIPNVGKSTLINLLVSRTVAVVGDKPAVTKVQQHVVLDNGMILTDSPGLLWPKIEDEEAAFRLALAGSIPDTAIDYPTIGAFAARFLLASYPQLLLARFKLAALPASPDALLTEIARRRGALIAGGGVDIHKAAEILVREVRSGALGRLSLESPPASPPASTA